MFKDENAILTIRSQIDFSNDERDRADLNAKAVYRYHCGEAAIRYNDVDEQGSLIGQTVITITKAAEKDPLVSIRKTGFTDTTMVFETGKTHTAEYETQLGCFHMLIHTLEVRAAMSERGGDMLLRYVMNIGDNTRNVNTVLLHIQKR